MKIGVLLVLCFSVLLMGCASTHDKSSARLELKRMRIPFNKESFFRNVRANKPNIVDLFLKAGFDPSAVTNYGDTALHLAAETGAVEIVELLVHHEAVDSRNSNHETPLMVAARTANCDCLELLLRLGANVNATDEAGQTALMLAAAGRRRSPPDSPHASVSPWPTPEVKEIKRRYYQSVKVLIAYGADLNAKMRTGRSALDLAGLSGQPEIIDLLKTAGAER